MPNGDVDGALDYLSTGGVSEIVAFSRMSRVTGEPQVQMDTPTAIALCMLAEEALRARKAANPSAKATK